MSAKYIVRLDDIHPRMRWAPFQSILKSCFRCGIKPLLAVVPANGDPALNVEPERAGFWDTIARYVEDGLLEIGQHGYRHVMHHATSGIINKFLRLSPYSEFSGLSYDEQLERICLGKEILAKVGLRTQTWVSPNHSFDHTTIRALRTAGFLFISDGVGVYPYEEQGLTFVPQQLWRIRTLPIGIWTVCFHPNEEDEVSILRLEKQLSNLPTLSFLEATRLTGGPLNQYVNHAIASLQWIGHRIRLSSDS